MWGREGADVLPQARTACGRARALSATRVGSFMARGTQARAGDARVRMNCGTGAQASDHKKTERGITAQERVVGMK